MTGRIIMQGQYTAPAYAADAYIGEEYRVSGADDDGAYSANPGDYWDWPDDAPIGDLWRVEHPYVTTSGRTVYSQRHLKTGATMRDLRRLAAAAVSLVMPERRLCCGTGHEEASCS